MIIFTSCLKRIKKFFPLIISLLVNTELFATVTILRATGGTSISADRAANATVPVYTNLGIVRLTEGTFTDFAIGTNVTLLLNAPAGWTFNTAASITSTFTALRDITAATVTSVTTTAVTVQLTIGTAIATDVLTITGLQVRAIDGANVTGSGNITSGGTAVITGCPAGTNLGTLTQAVGALYRLIITLPGQTYNDATTLAGSGQTGIVTNQSAGTAFIITQITAIDQFWNRVTTYAGAKTITYSGPSNGLTAPSYTTAVTFASGRSSTILTTTLKRAQTTTITATDGVVAGMTSSNLLVNPGTLNKFLVESSASGNIGSQIAATSFNIKVTAQDVENNTCSSGPNNFTGTVTITSNGTLATGGGVTPALIAGVLASHTVTVSNTGNFTITATRTSGGVQTGTSNSFTVNPGVLNNFLVEKQSGGAIGSQITGTSFNIKITARDVNNNTCSSGPNNFFGTVDITSTGALSSGGGTTTSFTAGILSSAGMTISNAGNFTLTAIRTSGSETGTSNSFAVDYPVPVLTNISPDCAITGGSSFTLTVNGSNFTGSSVVRINGSNRTTTFINGNQVQANITAGDISSPGIKNIDVQNPPPGGGTTSTAILTVSSVPGISIQPTNQSACNNLSSGFSVTATGFSLSYQWMKNGAPLTDGGNISGVTTSTLSINPATIADASSSYYVVISTNCNPDINSDSVSLTIFQNTSSTANISICDGQSYTPPGGSAESTSGTYITHIPNTNGCDSAITTNLTVIQNTSATANISICDGQSYTPPGGSAETISGTYITHIPNAEGCDSAITTNLTVIPNTSSTANIVICNGNSYTPPGGSAQTTTGIYFTTILNATGCDSTITTNLSVITSINVSQNVEICLGNSTTLPDLTVVSPTMDTDYINTFPSISVPGCDSIITIHVFVNPLPVLTTTAYQIQCTSPTGRVVLNISNGTPSYSFSGSDTINLAPGTYFFNVTDSKGCTASASAVINSAPPQLILNSTVVQIRCFNSKGSVTLNATGGVHPYTYGGDATSNLSAGLYNYLVTDANGCTDSISVTINPAPTQIIHTATPTQIVCYLGRGSVSLNTTGGTPPYSFSGSPTTNLTTGNYFYTVTDSRGCVVTASTYIAPGPARLTGTISTTTTRCDSNTGTASISASGGSAPYTFLWNTVPAQTTPQATGLPAGTYIATITDGHGCTATAQKAVTKALSTSIIITGKNTVCPGELTSLCATAGLVSYSWNTGETTRCYNAGAAGTYTVTATNINGCTSTATKVLTLGTTPVCSITGNDYVCPGTSVSLCASPSGLTTYTWNNGLRAQCRTVAAGGTYSVTVTNASGCTASASHIVKSPISIATSVTNGICSNGYLGYAGVNVTGQTSPYTYLWNNSATTQTISELNAGSYVVRVTDVNGCTATSATNVVVTRQTADYSTINSSFLNYTIAANNYIWFNGVVEVNYSGSYPLTIYFTNQNIHSSKFNLFPANARLVLTNSVSQATTSFNGTEWITTAPPNLSGQYFITGHSYAVPVSITPNLNPVSWKGIWTASCPGVSFVKWKWSASVYSAFTTNLDSLGVKPADGSTTSQYANSDLAGTPENFTANCIAGAKGAGITNYTGTHTNVGTRLPCAPLVCNSNPGPQARSKEILGNNKKQSSELLYNAYPNPFSSTVTIELERLNKSCNTSVEIYNSSGQKVKTIFDEITDPKIKYSIEFNAVELPGGIYIYKIISGEEVINGKLILKK